MLPCVAAAGVGEMVWPARVGGPVTAPTATNTAIATTAAVLTVATLTNPNSLSTVDILTTTEHGCLSNRECRLTAGVSHRVS